MTIIREQENKLFERWKNNCENFIPDGVVAETMWNTATRKILFLLREVNDCPAGFDERDYLKYYFDPEHKYMHSPTIDNLILWAYGIQALPNFISWSEAEKNAYASNILESVALVNIKKTSGGGTVDWDNFDKYFSAASNREYIKEQLQIYKPDIVICGGTAYYLSCLYPDKFNEANWKITSRGIRYIKNKNTVYIDYKHLNIRAPRNIMYYALMDTINEII